MVNNKNLPHRSNIFLLLRTNGGEADDAYRIARLCQTEFKKFYVCIPRSCKSAGTLIALGANKLIMSDLSEIGPLDVQLRRRDEIGQLRSGLVVTKALEGLHQETVKVYIRVMDVINQWSRQAVSFEVASRIATNIATGIMAPVYGQINPEALGNDLRDLEIAKEYGKRLIEHGKNANRQTIETLIGGYPSHGFVIDKSEAKTLFNDNDLDTSKNISKLIVTLSEHDDWMYAEKRPCVVQRLDTEVIQPTGGEGDGSEEGDSGEGNAESTEDAENTIELRSATECESD